MTDAYDPPRRYARLPVSIDCAVEGASGRASMRVSELSIGGGYVDTIIQFSEGSPVSIRAALPAGDVVLTGRVIYAQPGYGFGVAFEDLADSRNVGFAE